MKPHQPQASLHSSLNSSFSIQYGSGSAAGTLCQDTVTLAGFSVASQTFAQCDQVSTGLVAQEVSGIMGLGFTALAFSRATPWWITLARSNAWDDPLFGFYLKRYRNVAGASNLEADGGTVTFGHLGTLMRDVHSQKSQLTARLFLVHWQYHLCARQRRFAILGHPDAKYVNCRTQRMLRADM